MSELMKCKCGHPEAEHHGGHGCLHGWADKYVGCSCTAYSPAPSPSDAATERTAMERLYALVEPGNEERYGPLSDAIRGLGAKLAEAKQRIKELEAPSPSRAGGPVCPQEWVAGFCFTAGDHGPLVALIRKARPEWQRGKLNGIGGKIEPGETPEQAMSREWTEETAAISPVWKGFCTLDWKGGRVYFMAAHVPTRLELNESGDEPCHWRNVEAMLRGDAIIPNLRWLLPLALDKDAVTAQVSEPDAWNMALSAPRHAAAVSVGEDACHECMEVAVNGILAHLEGCSHKPTYVTEFDRLKAQKDAIVAKQSAALRPAGDEGLRVALANLLAWAEGAAERIDGEWGDCRSIEALYADTTRNGMDAEIRAAKAALHTAAPATKEG